jgi:hypothetical protein
MSIEAYELLAGKLKLYSLVNEGLEQAKERNTDYSKIYCRCLKAPMAANNLLKKVSVTSALWRSCLPVPEWE